METNPLDLLKSDVSEWNKWREEHPEHRPDLRSADLDGEDLAGANLANANLEAADLRRSDLTGTDLGSSDLSDANFRQAVLQGANLEFADLVNTNLTRADLRGAVLRSANLSGTLLRKTRLSDSDLSLAGFASTTFGATVLDCIGLAEVRHYARSFLDLETVRLSPDLPRSFLEGVGWSRDLIDFLPSWSRTATRFYSCFLSYSSADEEFAARLHQDLIQAGVRCWFAPHDLKVGARIRESLEENIQEHDKLILVLSRDSLNSDWVEVEAESAYDRERSARSTVLVPLRLDEEVLASSVPWAAHLRRTRNIGDFTRWADAAGYEQALSRLLRDLRRTG